MGGEEWRERRNTAHQPSLQASHTIYSGMAMQENQPAAQIKAKHNIFPQMALIVLFGSPITPVNVVRNLGVILDEYMTMSEHIARVCRNCYYQLRQIRRIKRSLTANSKTLLVLASVHSRLD